LALLHFLHIFVHSFSLATKLWKADVMHEWNGIGELPEKLHECRSLVTSRCRCDVTHFTIDP